MGFVISDLEKRWPAAIVPFEIDLAAFPVGSAANTMISDAIDIWNETRTVRFVPRTGQSDYVRFQNATSCSSPVGRRGGLQAISCQVDGGSFGRGSVIHEMGHAIGLYHEQQRPDRGSFVNVLGSGVDYDIEAGATPIDIYDCGSVMHYPNVSGKISNLGPGCGQMGQRISPSRTDLEAVRYAYPIHEVLTIPDTTDVRVALAGHEGLLFLAWQGSGNTNLNIALSTDEGRTFVGKHTAPDTSSHAPALASHNGRLYIAFKGDGNDNLNVAKVEVLGNTSGAVFVGGIADKVTLGDTSDLAPALASHGGRLFLAWKGSGNDNLSLAFSNDNGATFAGATTFAETSDDSPALVSHNGRLFLGWRGSGNENLNVARVELIGNTAGGFAIGGLDQKVTLAETSDFSPALGSSEGVLYLAWRGSGNEDLNIIASLDGSAFFEKRISFESSSDSPALATLDRRLYYGWKGSNNENINVGGVTTVIRPVGHAQNGNLIHTTEASKGNFDLLLASGGQLQHFVRNNDVAFPAWSRTNPLLQGPPALVPKASCLIQSRGPNVDLAAIHWMQPAAPGGAGALDQLHFSQSLNGAAWTAPGQIVADGTPIQGVSGKPSFLQGRFGGFGHFDMVVPAGRQIHHYWRDNDAAGNPWHGPVIVADFTPAPGAQPLFPTAVSLIEGATNRPGNLEFVARITPKVPGIGTPKPEFLVQFFRDANGWHGPDEILADGVRIQDVTGDPSLIWSTSGLYGNSDLVVPVAGLDLVHYWRENDKPDRPWHGPVLIHRFPASGPLSGRPVAASLIQGRFGGSPGNLELVVRVDPRVSPFTPPAPPFVVYFFRDGAGWKGPFPIVPVSGGPIANVTGF